MGVLEYTELIDADGMPEGCAKCPFLKKGTCKLPIHEISNGIVIVEGRYRKKRHDRCSLYYYGDKLRERGHFFYQVNKAHGARL